MAAFRLRRIVLTGGGILSGCGFKLVRLPDRERLFQKIWKNGKSYLWANRNSNLVLSANLRNNWPKGDLTQKLKFGLNELKVLPPSFYHPFLGIQTPGTAADL